MKWSITLQIGVVFGLLLVAILFLCFEKSEVYSGPENLSFQVKLTKLIAKLESDPPFPNKENIIPLVKTFAESNLSYREALHADAELLETTGYLLLSLASLQCWGIYCFLRSGKK
ncbi:MAG TPA: hypothetical protein VIF10_13340 [Methylobacter sp.]|jgi:hypothetical protein